MLLVLIRVATLHEKSAVLGLVVATKPWLIENHICEGNDCLNAALSCGITRLWVIVASERSVD